MNTIVAEQTTTTWVVLGADGRVIIGFSGAMAADAAHEWEARGFLVCAIDD